MKKLALLIVILFSCKRPHAPIWRGAPEGVALTCTYGGDMQYGLMMCVGGGRTWTCIQKRSGDGCAYPDGDVDCAPGAPPVTPTVPQ